MSALPPLDTFKTLIDRVELGNSRYEALFSFAIDVDGINATSIARGKGKVLEQPGCKQLRIYRVDSDEGPLLLDNSEPFLPPTQRALARAECWLREWWDALKAAEAEMEERPVRQAEDDHPPDRNVLRLVGAVWHVRYEENDENGDFQDRPDSVIRHLARLLAEPNHRLSFSDFHPPPPGKAPLPPLGRDASSDHESRGEVEKRMQWLLQQMKEAEDARDQDTVERLSKEYYQLAEYAEADKKARSRGRTKRCGTLSPGEKFDHGLRVALGRLADRLRKSGLPKLAQHIETHIDNTSDGWLYDPPRGTSPWHVMVPEKK